MNDFQYDIQDDIQDNIQDGYLRRTLRGTDMATWSRIYIWKRYIYVQFGSLNPLKVTSAMLRDILGPVYDGYVTTLRNIYPVTQFDSQNLRFSKYDIHHFQLIHPMQ